jgi:PadR family transcriptional regulator, regulatory protein PadR
MDNRHTQLLKGVLDMCLLALIAEQPCYGYEMVQKMTQRGLKLVSEGSIYPLLSRLQQSHYIESSMVVSSEGPKRKYYRIRPEGLAQLSKWQADWHSFSAAVDCILRERIFSNEDRPEGSYT